MAGADDPDLVPGSFPGRATGSANVRAQPCPSSNAQPRCMPIRYHSAPEAILAEGWQHEGMEPMTTERDGIWMTCRSCQLYYGKHNVLCYKWAAESHIQGRRHGKSRTHYVGSDDYYRNIALLESSILPAYPSAACTALNVGSGAAPEDEQPEPQTRVQPEDEQPEPQTRVQPEDEQPEAVLPQVQPEKKTSKANKIPRV